MKGRLFHINHITIISAPGSNLPTLLCSMSRLVLLNSRPPRDIWKSHLTKRQAYCLFCLFPLVFLSPSLLCFFLPSPLPSFRFSGFFLLCMDMFLPESIHSFNLTIEGHSLTKSGLESLNMEINMFMHRFAKSHEVQLKQKSFNCGASRT